MKIKRFRWLLAVVIISVTAQADIARSLSRFIGYRITDASYVRDVIRDAGPKKLVLLANGQLWEADDSTILPLTMDDVVVFENYGQYVLVIGRDVTQARLLKGQIATGGAAAKKTPKPTGDELRDNPIDKKGRDKHGATAADYRTLAGRYIKEGNNELAEMAEARAAAIDNEMAKRASSSQPAKK